jgi:hypothetical protein
MGEAPKGGGGGRLVLESKELKGRLPNCDDALGPNGSEDFTLSVNGVVDCFVL